MASVKFLSFRFAKHRMLRAAVLLAYLAGAVGMPGQAGATGTVNITTWRAMATRAGGEVVEEQ